ncbi:AbrB/MazE/SpoVT family DNA-binding domain-containing protein [Blastomonas sp.]|uniref:AbrB/MazE/SpoVT family DNA-binding domain-containing protein n=1 Tax=Blastomonas sp. TaxID=1909299 RepID=UPI003592F0EF
MGKEYKAKSFKSGNSVAIRMPAALGIQPDMEWTIVEDDGKLVIEPVQRPRKTIDVSGFWGKALDLHVPIREDFEERPSAVASRLKIEQP